MRAELRRLRRHLLRIGTAAGAAAAVSLAVPGAVLAKNPHGPKIDDRVAEAAALTSSSTPIPVFVFGNEWAARDRSFTPEMDLGFAAAGTVTAGSLDAIAADPNVSYVAPDVPVAPLGGSNGNQGGGNTKDSGAQALYPSVDDAPAAWSKGFDGRGIGIAIVDSGVNGGTLGDRLVASTGARSGVDVYGHGTLVAHFAAGNADGRFLGIAPQANVIDVAVGRGDAVYTSDVVAGLMWVLANKDRFNIRVLNLSVSETSPSTYATSVLDTAVELLWRSGVVVVTAAGNTGPGTETYAPSNDPYAISVGATDSNGTAASADDTVTPWSATGPTLDGFQKPDLVAPGRLVPGYLPHETTLGREAPDANWVAKDIVTISGTSFSAPQVTGAVADILQAHATWSPDQVKAVLVGAGRPQAGSTAPALDVAAAVFTQGSPAPANQGLSYADTALSQAANAFLTQGGWNALMRQAGWNALMRQAGWNALMRQAGWNALMRQAGWNTNPWTLP